MKHIRWVGKRADRVLGVAIAILCVGLPVEATGSGERAGDRSLTEEKITASSQKSWASLMGLDATTTAAQNKQDSEPQVLVAEVVVEGVEGELANLIYETIQLKPQGVTTRSQLQEDIDAIFKTGFFANVTAIPSDTENGVRVTFVVEPNPVLKTVQVNGSTVLPDSIITDSFADQYNNILNLRTFQEGIENVNQWYQENGYLLARVVDTPNVSAEGIVTLEVAEGTIEAIRVQVVDETGEEIENSEGSWDKLIQDNLANMTLQPGDIFRRDLVSEDLSKIYGLGNFGNVEVSLNPGEDPSRVILIYKAFPSTNPLDLVNVARQLAKKDTDQDRQAAIAKYEQAAAVYQQLGDRTKQAAILSWMGELYSQQAIATLQTEQQAIQTLENLVHESEEFDDILGLGQLIKSERRSHQNQPKSQLEKEQTISSFQQAATIFKENGNELAEILEYYKLAQVYQTWEEPNKAVKVLEDLLSRLSSMSNEEARWVEIATLNELGKSYQTLDDPQQALLSFQKILFLLPKLAETYLPPGGIGFNVEAVKREDDREQIFYGVNLDWNGEDGGLRAELGEEETSAETKAANREFSKRLIGLNALLQLGTLYQSLNQTELKRDYLQEAIAAMEAEADRAAQNQELLSQAMFISGLALVNAQLGEKDQARMRFEEVTSIVEELEADEPELVSVLFLVTAWFYDKFLDEPERAHETLTEAAAKIKQIEHPDYSSLLLLGLSWVYRELNQPEEAIAILGEATKTFQQRTTDYTNLLWLATAWLYREFDRPEKALATLAEAMDTIEEIEQPEYQTMMLLGMAWMYHQLNQPEQAIDLVERIAAKQTLIKEPGYIAAFQLGLGWLYSEWGDEERATVVLKEMFSLLATELNSTQIQLVTNYIQFLPIALDLLIDYGQENFAIALYEELLSFYQTVAENPTQTAYLLQKVGSVYAEFSEQPAAIAKYEQAAATYSSSGDRIGEARTFLQLGNLYREWGQYQKAKDSLKRVERTISQSDDAENRIFMFNSIAKFYQTIGEPDRTLEYYQQSLTLSEQEGDINQQVILLVNLGQIYRSLSDYPQAIASFQAAQERLTQLRSSSQRLDPSDWSDSISELESSTLDANTTANALADNIELVKAVLKETESVAVILAKLSLVYADMGDRDRAIATFKEAIAIAQTQPSRELRSEMLFQGAILYDALNDPEQAIYYLNLAESRADFTQNKADRSKQSQWLIFLGRLYAKVNDSTAAIEKFNQALDQSRSLNNPAIEIEALYELAKVQHQQGNLTESLTNIEAAIAIIESLRNNIASSQLRTSFFASKQDYYQLYIDLLMKQHQQNPNAGYDAIALHASERARARTLLELLAEANADIDAGVNPQLRERERILQRQINATASRQVELGDRTDNPTVAAEIQQELDRLLADLDEVKTEIRTASPRYAKLTQPQPLTLEQIQTQVLDRDTILLEYAIGEETSYLWAVTDSHLYTYTLPGRQEIEAAVGDFLPIITDPDLGQDVTLLAEMANPIAEMILAPVASLLEEKRLLIVPDGILNYIPFSALAVPQVGTERDDYVPLLVNHEIVNLPSASTLSLIRQETKNRAMAPKTMALIADPVFAANDPRLSGENEPISQPSENINRDLSRAASNFQLQLPPPRLPFTRQEADDILELMGDRETLKAIDFNASRDTVINPELSDYQIVHFATHGLLDSKNPELSGLILSMVDSDGQTIDGFLRLHDIFNLNIPAELVVLSACNTGLGENIQGEGLVGLTRGFMYAGSPRLVVSLWSVSDQKTADLMTQFYQNYLSEGFNAIAALRAAQIQLWESNDSFAPYYWAAFTFQGDWR